ncbi:MAG: hypothetical protein N5P05_000499 [Chroococcopsis gigantea SAG 12.99]|jgi:hypothetical protein|nr:hypothetical protein [Chlorogloea purpurea SAG 13.99]MDV2998893.1 hypothetical protein [Chroococcopsis gigantea SAG 12.99]
MIPSDINTIERLHAWTSLILSRYNSKFTVIETTGTIPTQIAFTSVFNMPDGTQRLISRVSLEIDPAWSSDKSHSAWYWVKEQSTPASISTSFTS